ALVHSFTQLPASHYYVAEPHWPTREFAKINVLDAGAGAAVHIRSDGEDWLFDCGSAREYERVLRSYLHAAGVNGLDGLLLSHGDFPHIRAAGVVTSGLSSSPVIC